IDAVLLVHEHLLHHLVDRRMMRANELADPERDGLAERRHLLTCQRGVGESFRSLAPHPSDDRDAGVAVHHQGVLGVPDGAGQLELDHPVRPFNALLLLEIHPAHRTTTWVWVYRISNA